MFQNTLLGFPIQRRGNLIQQQNLRIGKQRSRNSNSLPLSYGQTLSVFTQLRIQATCQFRYELTFRPLRRRNVRLCVSNCSGRVMEGKEP